MNATGNMPWSMRPSSGSAATARAQKGDANSDHRQVKWDCQVSATASLGPLIEGVELDGMIAELDERGARTIMS